MLIFNVFGLQIRTNGRSVKFYSDRLCISPKAFYNEHIPLLPDAVVVITKNLPLFTTPGNIGLKFFERTHAILDFDQSVVYLKGN